MNKVWTIILVNLVLGNIWVGILLLLFPGNITRAIYGGVGWMIGTIIVILYLKIIGNL